jgi:hypothetical protein
LRGSHTAASQGGKALQNIQQRSPTSPGRVSEHHLTFHEHQRISVKFVKIDIEGLAVNRVPDLREIPEPPPEILEAGLNGELVLFVGAGISMLLELPSWSDLAWKALQVLRNNELLNFSELEQLKNLDSKKQLSIAKLIAEENQLDLDLAAYFKGKEEGNSIYRAINDIGCACVTTNYDELLTPRFCEFDDDPVKPASVKPQPVSPQPVKRICDKSDFLSWYLDEPGTVVHLHGAINRPETMVVTTKEYLEHYDHENVQHFLGELFAKKTVLFVGQQFPVA